MYNKNHIYLISWSSVWFKPRQRFFTIHLPTGKRTIIIKSTWYSFSLYFVVLFWILNHCVSVCFCVFRAWCLISRDECKSRHAQKRGKFKTRREAMFTAPFCDGQLNYNVKIWQQKPPWMMKLGALLQNKLFFCMMAWNM